ncbi:hypothetical protein BGX23_003448 [Mortierella sp. AD031]|nr:hypothetical protein BGX23_003448 [Mortierella sp. AD031]
MDPSNLHIPNTTVTAQSNDNFDKEMREKALEMLRAINGLNTQHIAATTDPVHAEALKATLPKLDNLTFKFLSTFTSPEAAVFAMSTAQASEYSDLMDYISSAPDLPLPAFNGNNFLDLAWRNGHIVGLSRGLGLLNTKSSGVRLLGIVCDN